MSVAAGSSCIPARPSRRWCDAIPGAEGSAGVLSVQRCEFFGGIHELSLRASDLKRASAGRSFRVISCLQCLDTGLRTASASRAQASRQLVAALKKCRNLECGKKLHQDAVESSLHTNRFVATALITMYGKCRNMALARQVFDGMVSKNVVAWTSLITGYVDNGESLVAMDLFTRMDCEPERPTYLSILKACGWLASEKESEKQFWLEKGILIHKQVEERGYASDVAVANTLMSMYSKCGNMKLARQVFDRMVSKTVVMWSCIIRWYVETGDNWEALDLFDSMDCEPDCFAYAAAIKACGTMGNEKTSEKQAWLDKGISIHKRVKESGLETDLVVATSLIGMYSKCGSVQRAREVFDSMRTKDVVVWGSLILGYTENGESSVALDIFTGMDCNPDALTYAAVIKACGNLASEKKLEKQIYLEKAMGIHKKVEKRGFVSNTVLANTLVEMYSKCGEMQLAKQVFDRMVSKTVATWSHLMAGYVENGESLVALDLFAGMDCEPNFFTYVAALRACGALASGNQLEKKICLEKGISIHKQVKISGLETDEFVANSLVHMYRKCGSMQQAREVFDRMASKTAAAWSSIIVGYVENGESSVAMDLFARMDCEPSCFTYAAGLKACACLADQNESEKQACLEKGMAMHKQVKDLGFETDMTVATSLVDMYSKCGSMQQAKEVFDRMNFKDVVTWTSLILGYVENGESSMAMDLFAAMDCEPNWVTFIAALKACGSLGALAVGQHIHGRICKLGLEQERQVATSLLDFYGKCGNMLKAEALFENVRSPEVVTWNSLMAGYAFSDDPSRVFILARKMQQAGVQMDGTTFICILTACSHAGLVEEAKLYFKLMPECGVSTTVQHYTCMIDVLGRANRLHEALTLAAATTPVEGDVVFPWMALLGACSKWNNLEVGKASFDALVASGTTESAAYVLMSDLYKKSRTPTKPPLNSNVYCSSDGRANQSSRVETEASV